MRAPILRREPRRNLASFNRQFPYARFINLDVEVRDGRPLTILRKDTGNIGNPLVPMIHGGAVGALLEHAAALHLFHELQLGLHDRPKIVNISIDYLRPCLLVDTLAQGIIIRQGRRVANVRVEAWQTDRDRLVAAAHAHYLLPGD